MNAAPSAGPVAEPPNADFSVPRQHTAGKRPARRPRKMRPSPGFRWSGVLRGCALVQITETIPPDQLFRDYLYFSSFSDTHADSRRNRSRQIYHAAVSSRATAWSSRSPATTATFSSTIRPRGYSRSRHRARALISPRAVEGSWHSYDHGIL